MRADHQTHIWRESLVQFSSKVNPEDHGLMLNDDNEKLDIRCMRCNADPDEVILQLLFSPEIFEPSVMGFS